MTREVVEEASTFTLSGTIVGTASVSTTPDTLEYRIYDATNDRIVRDWTEITPQAEFSIDVIASDNEIYHDSRRPRTRFEERSIVISANRDTDLQYNKEMRYLIRNLRGFDS